MPPNSKVEKVDFSCRAFLGPADWLRCPRPVTLVNAPRSLLQLARSAYREQANLLRDTKASVGEELMRTLSMAH